jgi:7,8-dihydropterin-6-yl-methyl-4-(beta-D-ribofuranosyl)aminobenzene 5'-phosphate synthase
MLNPVLLGVTLVRVILSNVKIRLEAIRISKLPPLSIGATNKLEILPLYEAASRDNLEKGYGLSYLIKTDTKTILFDLGHNPNATSPSPLEKNMASLGIALHDIDVLIISHRHPDHVGGWKWWKEKTFSPDGVSQPELGDLPIYAPEKISYPGSSPEFVTGPKQLAEGVATTGGFAFAEPFPLWRFNPEDSEQSLAVNVAGKGVVLIVGCGHMGLHRLLRRAKTVFSDPIIGVIGGLHYMRKKEDELKGEIDSLKACKPLLVALSPHDSFPEAVHTFEDAFSATYRPVKVGEPIVFP